MSSFAKRERVGILQSVFDEGLMEIVTRERKRTDRSGLAMAMLFIGVQNSSRENKSALFAGVVNALEAIKSDVDIIGWFERGAIMGLIVPKVETANLARTCGRLESECRKKRSRICLFEGDLTERLSIKLCVYPETPQVGDDEMPGLITRCESARC